MTRVYIAWRRPTSRHAAVQMGPARVRLGIGVASSWPSACRTRRPASPPLWNAQSRPRCTARGTCRARLEAAPLLRGWLDRIGVGIRRHRRAPRPHGVGEQRRPRGAELAAVAEAEVARSCPRRAPGGSRPCRGPCRWCRRAGGCRRSSAPQRPRTRLAVSTIWLALGGVSGVMSSPAKYSS